jgi:hypothetical protein
VVQQLQVSSGGIKLTSSSLPIPSKLPAIWKQQALIHISQATAEELDKAGKAHWIVPREDVVYAKGKGKLNTYWLQPAQSGSTFGPGAAVSHTLGGSVYSDESPNPSDTSIWKEAGMEVPTTKEELRKAKQKLQKTERLIDWNSNLVLSLLEQIVARRGSSKAHCGPSLGNFGNELRHIEQNVGKGNMVIDEVKSIITLPQFQAENTKLDQGVEGVSAAAKEQLRDYISLLDRNNLFQ